MSSAVAANQTAPVPGTSLRDLVAQALDIENRLVARAVDMNGELDPVLDEFLQSIGKEIGRKTDSYKFIMDKLEAGAELLADRAAEFENASASLLWMQESMKDRIKDAMKALNTDEVSGATWRFKLTKAKARLVVDDRFDLAAPENAIYSEVQVVRNIDKEKLRKDLEDGKVIPGAQLEESVALRNYVLKVGR